MTTNKAIDDTTKSQTVNTQADMGKATYAASKDYDFDKKPTKLNDRFLDKLPLLDNIDQAIALMQAEKTTEPLELTEKQANDLKSDARFVQLAKIDEDGEIEEYRGVKITVLKDEDKK